MTKKRQEPDFDPIPKEYLTNAILLIFAKMFERAKELKGNAGQVQRAFYRAHQQFPDTFANLLFVNPTGSLRSDRLKDIIFHLCVAERYLSRLTRGTRDILCMEPDAVQEILKDEKYYDLEDYLPDGLIDVLLQELQIT